MRCPACNILLATADWRGVEIDYCPKCWGIWLDRGELDALAGQPSGSDTEAFAPAAVAPKSPPARPEGMGLDGPLGPGPSFSWRSVAGS